MGDPRQSDQRTQSFHFPIVVHQSLDPAAQSSAQAPSSLSLHALRSSSARQAQGIPTTVRKTEVRMTPVRSQECECQQCEETTVRMRQKCEGQVCEGKQCECDFSAIGQNSEVIQIERSRRSFCLQDGVIFLSFSLSLSLSLSLSGYTLGLG